MGRILSVTPYKYTPPENGGHHGIILVDKLLSVHNEVLSLSTDNNSEHNLPLGVRSSYTIPSSVRRYIPYYITSLIDQKIEEISATHLFIHHHYLFPSAFRAAKRHNIPLYIRSHNIETERFKSLGKKWWPIMNQFEKYAYNKADRIFFVTEDDKAWAIQNHHLIDKKCTVMPFGIDHLSRPELSPALKVRVAKDLNLKEDVPWIFFMGKLDYPPNAQAVDDIVNKIYPILKERNLDFQLIIFGKNLDKALAKDIEKFNQQNQDIQYLGFVPRIEDVLMSCDVMLNPVNSGGGVKTKVVESIAWNNAVISSQTGALGMEKGKCGDQLILVEDENWESYAEHLEKIIKSGIRHSTPESFYEYYSIEKIAGRIQQYFENAD